MVLFLGLIYMDSLKDQNTEQHGRLQIRFYCSTRGLSQQLDCVLWEKNYRVCSSSQRKEHRNNIETTHHSNLTHVVVQIIDFLLRRGNVKRKDPLTIIFERNYDQ